MLPTAAVRRPAAFRIEASIWTVVVLPLVPVTASQGAASGPRRRQASSTSPQTGTPACPAAANSGLSGFQPGAVTISSEPSGRVSPSPRRTVMPSASSSAACARARSSAPSLTTVTIAPRPCSTLAAGTPETPSPATVTCLPWNVEGLRGGHLSAAHPA